ncbi:hypothetical protein Q3G72_019507 [Acer saccharum]|nr:hypothetical protein Q3G72_019507 [Acer saccharum]
MVRYEQNGLPEEEVAFFHQMVMLENVNPDCVTLVSLVSACAQLCSVKLGSKQHKNNNQAKTKRQATPNRRKKTDSRNRAKSPHPSNLTSAKQQTREQQRNQQIVLIKPDTTGNKTKKKQGKTEPKRKGCPPNKMSTQQSHNDNQNILF